MRYAIGASELGMGWRAMDPADHAAQLRRVAFNHVNWLAALSEASRSDEVGAECDSVCARLLECHAADGEGLRYRFRDRKIAARCPGVPATRSNARRFQIIANYSMSWGSLAQQPAEGCTTPATPLRWNFAACF